MKNKFSFVIDIIAGVLSIFFMVLGIILSKDGYALAGAIVFGSCMILYCIFKALDDAIYDNEVLHRLSNDCLMIALAGAVTYYFLQIHSALSWTFFGISWGLVVLGIIFNSIGFQWMNIGRWVNMFGLLILLGIHSFGLSILPGCLFLVSAFILRDIKPTISSMLIWISLLNFY